MSKALVNNLKSVIIKDDRFPKWGDTVNVFGKELIIEETNQLTTSITITMRPNNQITEDIDCEVVKQKQIENATKKLS